MRFLVWLAIARNDVGVTEESCGDEAIQPTHAAWTWGVTVALISICYALYRF